MKAMFYLIMAVVVLLGFKSAYAETETKPEVVHATETHGGDSLDAALEEAILNAYRDLTLVQALAVDLVTPELADEFQRLRPELLTSIKGLMPSTTDEELKAMREGKKKKVEANINTKTNHVLLNRDDTNALSETRLVSLFLTEAFHDAGLGDDRWRDIARMVAAIKVTAEGTRALVSPKTNSFPFETLLNLLDQIEDASIQSAKTRIESIARIEEKHQRNVEGLLSEMDGKGIITLDLGKASRIYVHGTSKNEDDNVTQTGQGTRLSVFEDSSGFTSAYAAALRSSLDGSGLMVVSFGVRKSLVTSTDGRSRASSFGGYAISTATSEAAIHAFAFVTRDPQAQLKVANREFEVMRQLDAVRSLSRMYRHYLAQIEKEAMEKMKENPADASLEKYTQLVDAAVKEYDLQLKIDIVQGPRGGEQWFNHMGLDAVLDHVNEVNRATVKIEASKEEAKRDVAHERFKTRWGIR